MSDIYKVVTPENVELDYEIAGIGSRFLALMIDLLIQSVFIIGILYVLDLLKLKNLEHEITKLSTSLMGAIVIGLLLVIYIGYYIILETVLNGQTIGKKIINIRVRKEGGYAPSFWDILLRNIIRTVDFLPFFYGIGLIVMFSNQKSKRLGDYAAGTIVVKEVSRRKIKRFLQEQVAETGQIPEPITSPKYPWLHPIVSLLTQPDYLLLKNLYSRRTELTNIHPLALIMIRKIFDRIGPEEPFTVEEADALTVLEEMIKIYEYRYFN